MAVRFVEDVGRRPGVQAAVRQLAGSKHAWVREAALLAQERAAE